VLDSGNLYLTIINKEHGQYGRDAEVTVKGIGIKGPVEIMYLKAPNNDVSATSGISLGNATINNTGEWQGKWTVLPPPGNGAISVPAASAAIVRIGLRENNRTELRKASDTISAGGGPATNGKALGCCRQRSRNRGRRRHTS